MKSAWRNNSHSIKPFCHLAPDSRKDGTEPPSAVPSRRLNQYKDFILLEARIVQILSRPLFFCGLYYRRVLVAYDSGPCGERRIEFKTREAAEKCRVGDKVIL
ncbi:hypothetical protein ACTHSM_05850 [Neisseria sp. P0009.S001]|jgi:hypothetical protein|uniref:hypothetical protein n=1 Tax=unclassified Neisseria TaxID=2623750 RepID=UPI002069972E|nr:MAG TPA: hypothetical protein [Caudoviricetes sp.]